MSAREAGAPPSPLPPSVPENVEPAPAALDAIDRLVVARLAEPRLFQVGPKRILRGRLPSGAASRTALRRELTRLPVDVFFEQVGSATFATVSRPRSAVVPRGWPKNLALFLLTLFTTTWAGAYWSGVDPFAGAPGTQLDAGAVLRGLAAGVPFALGVLAILTCHEFGHFFAARRYRLETTLPFFLPLPPLILGFGTLGAVIKMNTPLYNRRILMDVGAAGPLAGMAAALPVLAWGIARAPAIPPSAGAGLVFNEPLLFSLLERVLRPELAQGGDLLATPLVLAGWFGLLVTALNLLPVGQLDGGHILYALLGRGQHAVGLVALIALAALGLRWEGWWLWVVLILLIVKVRHPPVLDLDLPLDAKRLAMGWVSVLLLLLCFHPEPIELRLG